MSKTVVERRFDREDYYWKKADADDDDSKVTTRVRLVDISRSAVHLMRTVKAEGLVPKWENTVREP